MFRAIEQANFHKIIASPIHLPVGTKVWIAQTTSREHHDKGGIAEWWWIYLLSFVALDGEDVAGLAEVPPRAPRYYPWLKLDPRIERYKQFGRVNMCVRQNDTLLGERRKEAEGIRALCVAEARRLNKNLDIPDFPQPLDNGVYAGN